MTRTLSTLIIFLTFCSVFGQKTTKSFTVKFTTESINPDGILDEPIWELAGKGADEFWEYFPLDSVQAKKQSQIKMLYDDKNLYVGIKAYSSGKNYATQSLQRDFRGSGSDSFSLVFDTFNDGTNAFLFGINPYGVRREALIANGGTGQDDFNLAWDMKWKGDAKIYEDYFTAEMIIPLTSLKFKEGATKWRFNSYRIETQSNERSTWTRIPQNQLIYSLAFMGDMVFEKPLGKSRTPMALIPYINGIVGKDFENNEDLSNFTFGGDAKISVGNGINLDVTLNPDFSNVEVDNFVTNLTRFEVSLPERRQFFIDNNDLFGSFGNGRDANPFFSRRIGIAEDKDGETIENGIIGGIRLSGKLNKNWRLGLLNIQTEEDEINEIPSNNNTVLALQKKMFSRSNLSFIFVNRQTFGEYDFVEEIDSYNRVVGLDYNLASPNNTWTGKFFYHKAFAHDIGDKDDSGGMDLRYNSRYFNFGVRGNFVGEDFRSDLGFIRREDIVAARPFAELNFWPKKGKLNTHGFRFSPNFIWRPTLDYQNTDYSIFSQWEAQFKTQERINVRMFNRYTYLTDSFDPTGTDDGVELPANLGYHYTSFETSFQSDRRKVFSYSLQPGYGEFYNGKRYVFEGDMSLRLQPTVFISMGVIYNSIKLPEPYESEDILLFSPRINITFNKSIFWSTLIQYGNQLDNLGFNSRLQWRFAPLSDLFLVYNDNYFVNNFMPRSRSINLKLTYWLNI